MSAVLDPLLPALDGLFGPEPEPLSAAEERVTIPPQGGYVAKTCVYRAHNDHDPTVDASLREPLPTAVLARLEDGNVFESIVGARWRAAGLGRSAVFLDYSHDSDDPATYEAWESATIAAMDRGVRLIWNARLPRSFETSRTGEPDALIRVGGRRKANGHWAYVPVDVKNHRTLAEAVTVRERLCSTLEAPGLEAAQPSTVLGGGKMHLKDLMQLAHYTRMLEELGRSVEEGSTRYGAIIGKEQILAWADLDEGDYRHVDAARGTTRTMSPIEIYDQEFALRRRIIRRAVARGIDPSLTPLVGPENKQECRECPWRTVCHDELVDGDHVTLLAGMTPLRAQVFYQLGIYTIAAVAGLDWPTAVLVDDQPVDVLELIAEARELDPAAVSTRATGVHAAAFTRAGVRTNGDLARLDPTTAQFSGLKPHRLADMIDQARVYKVNRVFRRRGVAHVEVPQVAVEFDIDMENGANDIIYLWGVKVTTRSRGTVSSEYRPFADFSGTPEGEARVFAEFWAFLTETRARTRDQHLGGFRAYFYSPAETRCLRALAKKHRGHPGVPPLEEVEALVASGEWVDLSTVLQANTLWPTEDLGLKSLAKFVKFAWRDEDANGGASVTWYDQVLAASTEEERRDAIDRILDYNEDDVTATYTLREWLRRLGEARRPGHKLPGVESLDTRFRRVRRTPVVLQTIRRERQTL